MKICEVTGRKHRTPREVTAELARLDRMLLGLHAIEAQFQATFTDTPGGVPEIVGDAWNALHSAMHVLTEERVDVEMNPRPIPAAEAETYKLVQQNID